MTLKEIRSYTNLSQEEFAKKYSIPLVTVKKWESSKKQPSDSTINYIKFQVARDYPHIRTAIFDEYRIDFD